MSVAFGNMTSSSSPDLLLPPPVSCNEVLPYHHLVKRTYYPGADSEKLFEALVSPETFPNFLANAFNINLFRGFAESFAGENIWCTTRA